MPLARFALTAGIRLHPSHSGASLSEVHRNDESCAKTSSKKDEEQHEFIHCIVRGGYERGRGRRRGRGRGRGRLRGRNPLIVDVGEIALADDEEVNQRVIGRGRQGGGS
jgi:hypothetical protein